MDKCSIPIIWLDTSVMLLLTKYMNNPQKLPEIEKHRISNLNDLLQPAVNSGKCIIPFCDQGEEVIGYDREDEWFNAMKKITLGVMSKSMWDIEIFQLRTAMSGLINGSNSIELSYKGIFEDDPVLEIKKALSNHFQITPIFYPFIRQSNTNNKIKALELINAERQKNIENNIDFDCALQIEQLKRSQSLKSFQQQHANSVDPLLAFELISIQYEKSMWESLKPNDIKLDLMTFYESDYYKKLPYVDLECFLLAKIKTRPHNIKSGDIMDIRHTSTLLPFSNLFITDKVWNNILKSERLDKKYNTVVTHLGDENEIKNFFNGL